MHTYVKKLQSKSENYRKQILVASLAVSMSLVVSVWIYGLSDRFNTNTSDKISSDLKPFQLFANSISNTYQNITASAGDAKPVDSEVETRKQIELVPVNENRNQ